MNIIIPMAGMGKRMRPHTLTRAKPLIPIAGKPIVERLVEDIVRVCGTKVQEIAFIISPAFGARTEQQLMAMAERQGAQGSIHYQEEALGTAHAILCARTALKGPVVVAFADTLFKANFTLDINREGIIWVNRVEDPRPFGVVKIGTEGHITEFHEKPMDFVSDLAIIGIYYFRDGERLHQELQYLIDHDIRDKGEYQLTSALERMKEQGVAFYPGAVDEWLDCGNKDATVYTNQRYLEFLGNHNGSSEQVELIRSVVIPPCYLGAGVRITDSVVGPHVSIGAGTTVEASRLKNCIIQERALIHNAHLENSMVGSEARVEGTAKQLSLGDFNQLEI
jgi:glucose-1-phosphate thymidylyltransferase